MSTIHDPSLHSAKGKVNPDSPTRQYEIDGLSGATITSRGIEALLHYWLGKDGFNPFLNQLKKEKDV